MKNLKTTLLLLLPLLVPAVVHATMSTGNTRTLSGRQRTKVRGQASSTSGSSSTPGARALQEDLDGNIFVHPSANAEVMGTQTMQVACGSAESPFLTTFVTSLQFRETPLVPVTSSSRSGSRKSHKKSSKTKNSKGKSKTKHSSSYSYSSKDSSGKGKGGGKSSKYASGADKNSHVYDDASGDGFYQDETTQDYDYDDLDEGLVTSGVVPNNELTPNEQQILQELFRDVYNYLTFQSCDGFFRTVYTAAMTQKEQDDEDRDSDGTYSVTLSSTQVTATSSATLRAGTEAENEAETASEGGSRRRLTELIQDEDFMDPSQDEESPLEHGADRMLSADDMEESAYDYMGGNNTMALTNSTRKQRQGGGSGFWGTPDNYEDNQQAGGNTDNTDPSSATYTTTTQTVTGDDLLTIYYVTLTATCRNCEVTPEVNFPLLMIETTSTASAAGTSGRRLQFGADPETTFGTGTSTQQGTTTTSPNINTASPEPDDVCMCPVGSDRDQAAYQRTRQLQQQQQNLYVPQPDAPTADEFIVAMNSAIRQNRVLNRRLVGIQQLVEPDYFNGENPELVDTSTPAPTASMVPTMAFPTVAPLTRPPSTPFPTRTQDNQETSAAIATTTTTMLAMTGILSSLWFLWL